MVLFLRTKANITLCDIEIFEKKEDGNNFVELRSAIPIADYSRFLFKVDRSLVLDAIRDFDDLSELRGWMWESYFAVKKNNPEEYKGVLKEVRGILNKMATKYDLMVIED